MKKHTDDIPLLKGKDILRAPTLLQRRAGRPRGSQKLQVNLRLDRDILEWLKKNGEGYQTRLNDMLRKIMEISSGHLSLIKS